MAADVVNARIEGNIDNHDVIVSDRNVRARVASDADMDRERENDTEIRRQETVAGERVLVEPKSLDALSSPLVINAEHTNHDAADPLCEARFAEKQFVKRVLPKIWINPLWETTQICCFLAPH